jgi:hypothetical protein
MHSDEDVQVAASAVLMQVLVQHFAVALTFGHPAAARMLVLTVNTLDGDDGTRLDAAGRPFRQSRV